MVPWRSSRCDRDVAPASTALPLPQFVQKFEAAFKLSVQNGIVMDTKFARGIGEFLHAVCAGVDADKTASEDSLSGAERHVARLHGNARELQQVVTEARNLLKGFYDEKGRGRERERVNKH